MVGSCSFQNGRYKNAANDCNCLSQQLAVLSSAFMQLDGRLYLYSRLLNEPADPANVITWKSSVSRDPDRQTGRQTDMFIWSLIQ